VPLPIIISDKSFLQALNAEEAAILDLLFVTNITPVFYVEVLGDLEKNNKDKDSQESIVRNLSYKTPKIHPQVNINHLQLGAGDLLGQPVQMVNKPIIWPGREVNVEGDIHILHDVASEVILFEQWSKRIFSQEERELAKQYRGNLEAIPKISQPIIKVDLGYTFKDFQEVKNFTDGIVNGQKSRLALIKAALNFFNIIPKHKNEIIVRWKKENCPPLSEFAPYAAYVMSVFFFFQVSVLKGFLSDEKKSNWMDLAYLFYLPFTEFFISGDYRFHEKIVPLFMKDCQCFIRADQMKKDLKKLVEYYQNHPERNSISLIELVQYPPIEGDFLISSIYDKVNPGWREHAKNPIIITHELSQRINADLYPTLKTVEEKITKGLSVSAENIEGAKSITFMRNIPAKLGKWELIRQKNTVDN